MSWCLPRKRLYRRRLHVRCNNTRTTLTTPRYHAHITTTLVIYHNKQTHHPPQPLVPLRYPPSLMASPHYNNSDDEESPPLPQLNDDFVSFPTIPDPEQESKGTFKRIFTQTIRKVTTNATHLVPTYGTSPKPADYEMKVDPIDLDGDIHEVKPPEPIKLPPPQPVTPAQVAPPQISAPLTAQIPLKTVADMPPPTPLANNAVSSALLPVANAPVVEASSSVNTNIPATTQGTPMEEKSLFLEPSSRPSIGAPSVGAPSVGAPVMAPVMSTNNATNLSNATNTPTTTLSQPAPRVTSDNRLLRLLLFQYPTPNLINLAMLTLANVTVLLYLNDRKKPKLTRDISSLQNKITLIFNNLPNDIELSDDEDDLDDEGLEDTKTFSTSVHEPRSQLELDTEAGISGEDIGDHHHRRQQLPAPTPNSDFTDLPVLLMNLYLDLTARELRVKVSHGITQTTVPGPLPSLKLFYALKNKDTVTKKPLNLLTLLIDNAKHIILATAATAKRKRPPKRGLHNPLKTGGIPKKYWINDAFVLDCLNCFKPFTAFRRKHHCRFCGQIFCLECTLFILYNQHRDERRRRHARAEGVPLPPPLVQETRKMTLDSLRVCKPCLVDVIVYLSDDLTDDDDDIDDDDIEEQLSASSTSKLDDGGGDDGLSDHTVEVLAPTVLRSAPPKPAPQMAIPATRRRGEAVEIPVLKQLLPRQPLELFNHPMTLLELTPLHVAFRSPITSKWYPQITMSNSDLERPRLYDNLLSLYSLMVVRKALAQKLRMHLALEEPEHVNNYDANDVSTFLLSPGAHSSHHALNTPKTPGTALNLDMLALDLSDAEDEQVMLVYNLLMFPGGGSAAAVPTLREFPLADAFPRYPGTTLGKLAPLTPLGVGVPPPPQPPSALKSIHFEETPTLLVRLHERAHASLLRMRLRRRLRSLRNVLLLTQLNYRLPSFEMKTSLPPARRVLVSPPPRVVVVSKTSPATPASPNTTSPVLSLPNLPTPGRQLSKMLSDGTDGEWLRPPRDSSQELADIEDNNVFDDADTELLAADPTTQEANDYQELIDAVIVQCLEDSDVHKHHDEWVRVINNTLCHVHYIKLTDTLDVRQYVKIKKLLGGKISQTSVVDGLFFTKNVDLKKMALHVTNPKIVLLMFPVEYLKHKQQFILLRMMHSQQQVYITNLVLRLILMSPDVVVVGDSVCGLAEQLLEEAGITVISNVKPQVVERISRYTKADIFQLVNDLFFKKGHAGTCQEFCVRHSCYKGVAKSLVYFTGVDIGSGFTVALRGGDEDTLTGAKYAAELVLAGVLNEKFELLFFTDLCVSRRGNLKPGQGIIEPEFMDRFEAVKLAKVDDVGLDSTEVVKYIQLFSTRLLTLLPLVHYGLPEPLVRVVEAFYDWWQYHNRYQRIQLLGDDDEVPNGLVSGLSLPQADACPNGTTDIVHIIKYSLEVKLRLLGVEFQLRARNWLNLLTYSTYQLYPMFHRQIHVLHLTVSIKHATPCTGPSLLVVDYYTDNDKCLGTFLDVIFQESPRVCRECGDPMLNHYNSYVHGHHKLLLVVEKLAVAPQVHNQRVMWSYCRICGAQTPVAPMHDETYYLLVGKFMELSFYGKDVKLAECGHSFFADYTRCFGLNDMVIRADLLPIDTYEVVVPKKQLEDVPEVDFNLKVALFGKIESKLTKFFDSVLTRLTRVKLDTFDSPQQGLAEVQKMKDKVQQQRIQYQEKLKELYDTSLPTNYLSLNEVLREVQKLAVDWDAEFSNFEHEYLPLENDVTKITQFHLRNFLLDADDQRRSPQPLELSSTLGTQHLDDLPQLNREKTKEIGLMIPHLLYDPATLLNFKDKRTLWQERINSSKDETVVPVPTTTSLLRKQLENLLGGTTPNPTGPKVSQLALFFDKMNIDQILLEFKKQRERELRRRADRFTLAQPVLLLMPIVEVYDNIDDAVEKKGDKKGDHPPHDKPDVPQGDNKQEQDANPEAKGKSGHPDKDAIKPKDQQEPKETKDKDADTMAIKEAPSQTRNVELLFKQLTTFWADRTATLWDPLAYPLDAHEHTFEDSDVIVREDEPSLLVAFCLLTANYRDKIAKISEDPSGTGFDLEKTELNLKKMANFDKLARKFKQHSRELGGKNAPMEERIMCQPKLNHLKYKLEDGNTTFSCKIFYSQQFEAFRKAILGSPELFIQLLLRCVKWNSKGGKLKLLFLKTLDDRYIVKELSKTELELFVLIAPFYFKYSLQTVFNNLTLALAKIFGFYQIEIVNKKGSFRMDFLIMENLFHNHHTTRIFDLKGLMRNRHVQQTGKADEVLLDENMIEYIYESPVFVAEQLKKLMRGSLFNDTLFLLAMDVMDYSLVVGIDDPLKKLYIGIIDWLRAFTWDKKVENWVKGNLAGTNKKGKDPTIITPKQYKTRFREAMERYILEVPDIWYEGRRQ